MTAAARVESLRALGANTINAIRCSVRRDVKQAIHETFVQYCAYELAQPPSGMEYIEDYWIAEEHLIHVYGVHETHTGERS